MLTFWSENFLEDPNKGKKTRRCYGASLASHYVAAYRIRKMLVKLGKRPLWYVPLFGQV